MAASVAPLAVTGKTMFEEFATGAAFWTCTGAAFAIGWADGPRMLPPYVAVDVGPPEAAFGRAGGAVMVMAAGVGTATPTLLIPVARAG
jgi:hypothetical protein